MMRALLHLGVVRDCLNLHGDSGKFAATLNVANDRWGAVLSEMLEWNGVFFSPNRQHCIFIVSSAHTFSGVRVVSLTLRSMPQLLQVQAYTAYIAPRLAVHEVTLDLHVSLDDFEQGNNTLTDVNFVDMPFVKRIGNNFLRECRNLHHVGTQGLANVESIGDAFMYDCHGLTSFDSAGFTAVTQIGDSFMTGCHGLKSFDSAGFVKQIRLRMRKH